MRIGIDMGGTSIKFGIVNQNNEIVAKASIPTDLSISAEALIKNMADGVKQLLKEHHLCMEECEAVGIGTPGTIDDSKGLVLYSNNYRWENVPLLAEMKKYISVPMGIANDADTAALGEVCAGAAKDVEDAVLLTLGTGVGTGVIMHKKIFHGRLAGGCEVGHSAIVYNGRLCTCGRKGCLEAYASANALLAMAREAMQEDASSMLHRMCEKDSAKLNGKMIFDAVAKADALAEKIVEEYEEYLACGIANVINIFRPSKVIIGGGLAAQRHNLTIPLQEKVNRLCFGGEYGQISEIVTSELGNDAGIIGAANLI